MVERTRPPFRADHVGSLIRPKELRETREAHLAGTLPAAELRVVEDRCIRDCVAMQERVGLQAVTDGEFRRTSFRDVLFDSMAGFSKERVETDFSFTYADGSTRRATPVPTATGRLVRRGSMAADDFEVPQDGSQGHAEGDAACTLDGPLVCRPQGAGGRFGTPASRSTWRTWRAFSARRSPSWRRWGAPTCRSTRCLSP